MGSPKGFGAGGLLVSFNKCWWMMTRVAIVQLRVQSDLSDSAGIRGRNQNMRTHGGAQIVGRNPFDSVRTASYISDLLTAVQYTEAREKVVENGQSYWRPELVREMPYLDLPLFKS